MASVVSCFCFIWISRKLHWKGLTSGKHNNLGTRMSFQTSVASNVNFSTAEYQNVPSPIAAPVVLYQNIPVEKTKGDSEAELVANISYGARKSYIN